MEVAIWMVVLTCAVMNALSASGHREVRRAYERQYRHEVECLIARAKAAY
jgi:hypothetical protein